jgi:hypothetical protein
MTSDPERLKRLGLAASFCLFDKKLRSSGNASIVWGAVNLVIGGAIVAGNNHWGIVSLLLGSALIATGVYERTPRHPRVVMISAAMLAGLALWTFTLIALVARGEIGSVHGGGTKIWALALAQALGAFGTWITYSEYKMVSEQSDPLTVEQVRGYVDELKKAKSEESVDLVEFDANAGFSKGTMRYRLKPMEELFLVARYKAQLGSLQLEEIGFVPRSEVTLTPEGEQWMGKKIKAIVQLGPLKLDKVTITSDMGARINPAVRALPLG